MDETVHPRTRLVWDETAADRGPEAAQHCDEARLEALFRLSQMADASFREVVAFGMEAGIRLTGSQLGYVALVNDDETKMTIHSWSQAVQAACRMEQQPIEFPLQSGGLLAEAVRQRQPFLTNDYAASDCRKHGTPLGHVAITRYLCLPVLHKQKVVLVAAVANKADDYTQSDVRQLTLLMQGVWLHLERQKTEETLRQHRDDLERLVAQRTAELNNRVQEMRCLRAISEVLEETPADDLSALQRVVEILPSALRRPEAAGAQITLNGQRWSTPGYRETLQRLSAPVFVGGNLAGAVDVCYLDDNPAAPEKPFLDEELALVEEVGRTLGHVLHRNLSEAKARSLQRQIEQVLAVTRTGLRIFDTDCNALYVDPARQRHCGPSRQDGCRAYCGGSRTCEDDDILKALAGKKPIVSERALHAEGGRPVQVTTIPYQDADGRWLVAQVEVDLSERKRMEQELSQAQRLEAIGHLAAGIAHEINTPIQFIGDNLRFLDEELKNVAVALEKVGSLAAAHRQAGRAGGELVEIDEALRQADLGYFLEEGPRAIAQSIEGVARVAEIVRAMKEFSHPGARDGAATDLHRAVESTLTVSRNEWKYVADLETDLAADLPPVRARLGDINQVLLNLVVNAAHAVAEAVRQGLRERGKIVVRTRRDGDHAVLEVEDTGIGIPEEIQPHIFTPFFTTKEVGRGTGQGLALARSLVVQKYQGTITFRSEPGKGTVFTVRLPLDRGADTLATSHTTPQELPG